MENETGQRDRHDGIEWTGEHNLLDTATEKARIESALLHTGCGARRLRIDVSVAPNSSDRDRRCCTLHVYMASEETIREWFTLEGRHGIEWIPRFAASRPETSATPARVSELMTEQAPHTAADHVAQAIRQAIRYLNHAVAASASLSKIWTGTQADRG